MKRIVVLLSCIILFFGCHKELPVSGPAEAENSGQELTKIVNTLIISSSLYSSDSITFAYDHAGKIITEGKTHYYRDDKERIVRITKPLTDTSLYDSYVFYSDSKSGKVDYVSSGLQEGNSIDSIAYLHDNADRVSKIMEYLFFEDRDSFVLITYYTFGYDANSNIKQITKHALDDKNFITCWIHTYESYDNKKNPLYSDDEVRLLEYFWGLANISSNNVTFTGYNNYHEQYEYREDGRPRLCRIYQSGKEIYRSFYYYK